MSQIEEQIDRDLKEAMKSKKEVTVGTLRMVKTAFMEAKTQKNAKAFDDQQAIAIISKMVSLRVDTARTYESGGRLDLSSIELAEIDVLKNYLPAEISDHYLEEVVTNVIRTSDTPLKMGDIIKESKRIIAQENLIVDGKKLSEIVKALMSR